MVYNKIQVFKLGMFGTSALVKIFDQHNYPYMAVRYEDIKHEVATFPHFMATDQICDFIDSAADGKYNNQIDMIIKDRNLIDKYDK